jgi:hypothetical protein
MKGPNCWNCGQDKDFQIDGYGWGDRLLEGVMFNVTYENKKVTVSYPNWENDAYMIGLNTPYWIDMIQKSVETGDYDDSLYCIHCKEWMA